MAGSFFDRDCEICTRLAHRFRGALAKRGFGLAALQDPRAASLLSIPPEEMLREMRVVTTEGSAVGRRERNSVSRRTDLVGVAVLFCRGYPACGWLLDAGYRWFAAHRRCSRPGASKDAS